MTAPVMLAPDDVRRELRQSSITMLQQMREKPRLYLYDKDWSEDSARPLFGVVGAAFEERLNDTGEGSLRIFATHKLRDYLIEELDLWEDLHIRVDLGGKRWTGKCSEITELGTDDGHEYIDLKFLHEYEHVKKIVCYCNPLFPAELQVPKIFALACPAVFGVKTMFFLNLLRRFALPWTLSDNIFNPGSWAANLNPANWPIVVLPGNLITDTSMWSIISTRFGNAHDVIAPTLSDAECQVIARRWFPGDPQPAPQHMTLAKSTLTLDVVDKSGYVGPSGTMFDGLLHFIKNVAEDLINEVNSLVALDNPAEYSLPGFLGTTTKPWVAWRNAQRTGLSGIGAWQATVHKALAGAIVTGGHSPDWVNTGLKLLANAILGYIGALFGNPGLTLGIFDSQLEDILFAFHRVPNPWRMAKMGSNAYGEYWESSGGTGLSLSALQAIRTGFDRTKAYRSYKVSVVNGAPYWVGRHFDVGDRVAAEVGKRGNYYVDHVYAIKWVVSREKDLRCDISIGHDGAEDQPGAMLARQIAQVKGVLQAVSVAA